MFQYIKNSNFVCKHMYFIFIFIYLVFFFFSVDIGPGTWKEIYHGILSTQIKMVKFFSLSTSILGLSVQPILFQVSV